MKSLPARHQSLERINDQLNTYVDEIGINETASLIGVSADTVRRRIRGEQPWFFNEILDLAREQCKNQYNPGIAEALVASFHGETEHDFRPLRIPSELREVLRLVGKLTTDIADTLEDGIVDAEEAGNLLELLARLEDLTDHVKLQLKHLVAAG
ncbi:MAG: hypothetical protein HRU15_17175 [Planctomycetes bacterium]|nr:hypothetical protein [Planctomycetota bacterium]